MDKKIDYAGLEKCIDNVVRFLDNALDISISNFSEQSSIDIMSAKRKIGVGMCGFADALINLGISYGSEDSINVIRNITSFMNYSSKKSSINLAKHRGSFGAFDDESNLLKKGMLIERYSELPSDIISKDDWIKLDLDINENGIRHVSTIALPPTGRSAPIIEASHSIEPHFTLNLNQKLRNQLESRLISKGYEQKQANSISNNPNLRQNDLPDSLKNIYMTCLSVDYNTELKMTSEFQNYVDESISKTINLPNNTSPKEIYQIYRNAHDMGLKGITVYRDGSKEYQPKKVN